MRVGITSFAPILLLLLMTHHSAPHKKVTVVKDWHTFIQDLMNWRSRALAASDARQSDGMRSGRERSCGVDMVSGEFLGGYDNNRGVGVVKGIIVGEAEAGTQFSVCRFENLGIIDSICRYKDYRLKGLSNGGGSVVATEYIPRHLWPN